LTAVRLKAKKSSLHSASCSRKTKSMRTLAHQSPTPQIKHVHNQSKKHAHTNPSVSHSSPLPPTLHTPILCLHTCHAPRRSENV
jgi:hypothetical protein